MSVNDSTLFFGASDLNLAKLYDPSVAPSTAACAPAFGSTPAVSTMPVASGAEAPCRRAQTPPAALRTSATVVSPFLPRPSATRVGPLPPGDARTLGRACPSKPSAVSPRAIDAERATDRSFGEDADADGTRIAGRAAA